MSMIKAILQGMLEGLWEAVRDVWLHVRLAFLFAACFIVIRHATGLADTYRVLLLTVAVCLLCAVVWEAVVYTIGHSRDDGFALRWLSVAFILIAPAALALYILSEPAPAPAPPPATTTLPPPTNQAEREAQAKALELIHEAARRRAATQPPPEEGPEPQGKR